MSPVHNCEPVQQPLRAKTAPVGGLGGCMTNLVDFVGKAALAARCLGRAKSCHGRDDVAARNIVSCLLDVNNLMMKG